MALINKNRVLKNLNREIGKIKGRTLGGMVEAATLIKNESQERTPVDTGNLKGSHYVAKGQTLAGPVAEVGTTAEYSVPVHEDLNVPHPTGEAKFLENAIKLNTRDILAIVAKRAKVKP